MSFVGAIDRGDRMSFVYSARFVRCHPHRRAAETADVLHASEVNPPLVYVRTVLCPLLTTTRVTPCHAYRFVALLQSISNSARLSTVKVGTDNIPRVVDLYKTAVAPVLQVRWNCPVFPYTRSLAMTSAVRSAPCCFSNGRHDPTS